MDTKKCIRCEVTKPLEAFTPDKRKEDGRSVTCRTCQAARRRFNKMNGITEERFRPYTNEAGERVKECRKCFTVLPITSFSKSNKSGVHSYCKECSLQYAKSRKVMKTWKNFGSPLFPAADILTDPIPQKGEVTVTIKGLVKLPTEMGVYDMGTGRLAFTIKVERPG
jgi:hypothetical protein